ncbi:MAG TPA: tRNA (adenosine(37)-N6)-threonylcarbamoyltransferase complex dimerization subunit type 1 TsaB [Pyrinomonadaceae bacterium]|nr:tRNA (adenosine(37)-N6)-threonylcarbamoyltransferase complex dimerization subunit type 1 TsaB [Pyrinomonadaceae bacterium]
MGEGTAGAGLLTLSADTATDRRSVAVMRGRRVLALRAGELRDGGASSALSEIDAALREASVALRDVELLAVAAGPGSFTGLRSGIATMKALAVTLNKPLVGVQTLHAVAFAARPARRLVAMLPAGRGEVFAQVLGASGEGVFELDDEGVAAPPRHVPPARLLEELALGGGGLKFAGAGAEKYFDLIEGAGRGAGLKVRRAASPAEEAGEGEWLVLAGGAEALAESVGLLAQAKLAAGEGAGADELRAIYVRPSDAELKERCQAPGQ